MTKEQEELMELHARFKELQTKRKSGELSEDEQRTLIQLSEELQERGIDALVEKALTKDVANEAREANSKFIEAGLRCFNTHQAVDCEMRATTMTGNVKAAMPTVINEVINPLEAELIHTKVGLKMQTGVVGQPIWPVLAGITATIANEDVALTDQTISLDKVVAKSERVGTIVPITIQALDATNLNMRSIVLERMGKAVGGTINSALFAKTAPVAPNNGMGSVLAAPYATPISGTAWSGTVAPTIKEIVSLEAEVLGKDVRMDDSASYFVHPKTYCLLKSTPVEKGNPQMILQDGYMNGYRVVSTTFMPEDAILFGVMSYAVLAHHGSGDRLFAQYIGRNDRIEFSLNGDYSLTVLRNEAFACMKRKA